ncbi:MAG: hypothetical protein K2X36_10675 [Microbacteriaceae bacterium]|nr:hypothetical protein [Microbacteriaceae bacterium]
MNRAEQRVADAQRALDEARRQRAENHSPGTAIAVASAQLRFDEARRALSRWDVS